jgi:trans-aconitate methyltransferase
MALLPDETLATVQRLQRELLQRLNAATSTEYELLEVYGETDETADYFDLLQNAKERVDTYYTRFYVTLRRVYNSQPAADRDTLELLARYIDEAEATIEGIGATVREIRRDFNLP